jgi:DNA-binding beta-propeller fold protein YncE
MIRFAGSAGRRALRQAVIAAAVITLCAWAAPTALASNLVYWANYSANTIGFANQDGTGGGGTLSITGTTPSGPSGVVLDPANGKIYWANANSNTIGYANLDGSGGATLDTTGTTLSYPDGLVIDHANGKIYIANYTNSTISFANLDGSGGGGTLNTSGTTPSGPIGNLALDPSSGRIYWSNFNGASIAYANADDTGGGGTLATTGATLSGSFGVAIDPALGRIYTANQGNNSLSFANLDGSGGGGQINTTGTTPSSPSGVAIDPGSGRIWWANQGNGTISYANVDNSGNGVTLNTTGTTLSNPVALALLDAPSPTSAPTISGGRVTTAMLSCSRGGWAADIPLSLLFREPVSYSYRWSLNGAPIAGATGSSLVATSAGNYSCTVTATNPAGSSAQTTPVYGVAGPPPPPPPPPPPTASMSSAVHGASATLTFSCSGVPGQSCSGTYTVTAHKTTCGSTVKAVTAAHKKHRPKCVTKVSTVHLGGGSYAVSAGRSTQTSFTVAHSGVALLFRFYRLPTTFTFSAFSSNAPSSRVVVFAYKRITSSLDNFQLAAGSSSTLVSSWPIKKIPRGATVKVTCHGGGCPFSQRVYRNKSHVSILQGAHLLVGSTVRVIVNAPFSVGEVLTATIESLAAPKEVLSCLPPGAGAPLKCTA